MIYILIAVFIISFSIQFYDRTDGIDVFIKYIYIFAVTLLSLFTGNILSQLGHYIICKLNGYEFISFSFYRSIWIKRNNKIVRYTLVHSISFGEFVMKPFENTGNDLRTLSAYSIGRFLLNMLIANLIFITLIFFPQLNDFVFVGLYSLAIWSIYLALIQIIPIYIGFPNDVSILFFLLTNHAYQRTLYNYLLIKARILEGKSFKEINFVPYEVDEPNVDYRNPLVLEMKLYEYYYYLYNFRNKEAEEVIDFVYSKVSVDKIPQYYRDKFVGEYLYIKMILGKKEEAIKLYLEMTPSQKHYIRTCYSIQTFRIRYAIYVYLKYDKTQANNIFSKCMKNITYNSYSGQIENEQELIRQIKDYQDKN